VLSRYSSLWPVQALVDIHQDEVREREKEFRERNESNTTLPDFQSALFEEVETLATKAQGGSLAIGTAVHPF
jgi:hypothetical protein